MSEKNNPINGYSSNYWKAVVSLGLIYRPHESLRDRYKRFIKYLTKENILQIIRCIKKRGSIEGYLNFIKYKNNFKLFSHISFEDPFASKKQTFSGHNLNRNTPLSKCLSSTEDTLDSFINKKEETLLGEIKAEQTISSISKIVNLANKQHV